MDFKGTFPPDMQFTVQSLLQLFDIGINTVFQVSQLLDDGI